ncbi:YycH family regulatory protein [Oceanobacillus halotolerans]|uniref:YycH family regulatory protein n=1 Tax=Oceanobacillus halotolerans TaxID=2663380 RepID=UPI0013D45120|nr:two-component system activity regulator YycH [Oceanobacillus halotolerans]
MKWETVKTIILTLLVGFSFVLTFGLWNFQPNDDLLYDQTYVNEVNVGGTEQERQDIIQPSSIIFHSNYNYFGFTDPMKQQQLYEEMQSWVLFDLQTVDQAEVPMENFQVEVRFPDALPMEIISNLFSVHEDETLPQWSFDRIMITFDEDSTSLMFHFIGIDGEHQAQAIVNNTASYEQMWEYVTAHDSLGNFIVFEHAEDPIYIPENPDAMIRWSLTVNNIEPTLLVNTLFNNPSIVSRNISNAGEAYFTDGQREMRVFRDERNMEFFNPFDSTYERLDAVNLLDISISNINEHNGWTDDYQLVDLNHATSSLKYQMYFEGHPIFNRRDLTIMEQQWREQELYQYNRPLFQLNDSLGGDSIDLPSGHDIIYALENTSANYNLENIADIQVGYRLTFQDSASNVLTLIPSWYMKYNESWQEINIEELKGGG